MKSPYIGLKPSRFWRTGVSEAHPLTVADLYQKKFAIGASDMIATAGSCFAQHVANHLRTNGFSVMDVESSRAFLPPDVAKEFGYGIYSARYGNIYTVRQLLQLARDADRGTVDPLNIWTKGDRFYDAVRPNIEPNGFDSPEEVTILREQHLAAVKRLFRRMNVFIFTLGLTEAWVDKRTDRVFPTAPGTIAGDFDPSIHEFKNFTYDEIRADFVEFLDLVRARNRGLKVILTVSPVPLTATATDNHVLVATTYSKSVLRAVAGSLADTYPNMDYFPSYEMIASPWSKGFFYEANMRAVNPGGVTAVMRVFFEQHGTVERQAAEGAADEQLRPQLEERTSGAQKRQRPSRAEARAARVQAKAARAGATPESTATADAAINENVPPEVAEQRRQQSEERLERQRRRRLARAEAKTGETGATTESGEPNVDAVASENVSPVAAGEQRRRRPKGSAPQAKRHTRERSARERPSRDKAARAKANAERTEAKADDVVCEDILLEAFNR